ncbi:unnamed protein product [Protopolystoma xenopodis]|uniref:Uncharacterized protein n=1 Tax=Protopolystoma xenopodis TaxID=117903 RepID=A0A448XR81_9PLAT|nr:unnamed protein product [Protopolystoma xenopodis]
MSQGNLQAVHELVPSPKGSDNHLFSLCRVLIGLASRGDACNGSGYEDGRKRTHIHIHTAPLRTANAHAYTVKHSVVKTHDRVVPLRSDRLRGLG